MGNKFCYEKGDIEFKSGQCEFCRIHDSEKPDICVRFPMGKPMEIINTEKLCPFLQEENNRQERK